MISRCDKDPDFLHDLKLIGSANPGAHYICLNCAETFRRSQIDACMYFCGYCNKQSNNLQEMTDHIRSHERGKMKYTDKFKNGVSVLMIEKVGPCSKEFYKFAYLVIKSAFTIDTLLPINTLVSLAEECEGGIDWLIEERFIEPSVEYKIGDWFTTVNNLYVLAAVGSKDRFATLINVETGSRMHITSVNDFDAITDREFSKIVGKDKIEPVKIKSIAFISNDHNVTRVF